MHPRQRLPRHPRRSAGGDRRSGALSRHVRRWRVQPAAHPGTRPHPRGREPGQPAQLAAAALARRRRPVGQPRRPRGERLPAEPGPARRRAAPPLPPRRHAGPGHHGHLAAAGVHGRAAPGRAGDHPRRRELVRHPARACRHRRAGGQRPGRRGQAADPPPPAARRAGPGRAGRPVAADAHQPVPHRRRGGHPHPGPRIRPAGPAAPTGHQRDRAPAGGLHDPGPGRRAGAGGQGRRRVHLPRPGDHRTGRRSPAGGGPGRRLRRPAGRARRRVADAVGT